MQEVTSDPDLIHELAEDILRLESPAQGMFRRCAKPSDLSGTGLREGDLLNIRFGAANRDERQFPDPDRIDLHRAKPCLLYTSPSPRDRTLAAYRRDNEIISSDVAPRALE